MVNPRWVQKYGPPPTGSPPDTNAMLMQQTDVTGKCVALDMHLVGAWPDSGLKLPAVCTRNASHLPVGTDVTVYADNMAVNGEHYWTCSTCNSRCLIPDPFFIYAERGEPRRVVRLDIIGPAVTTLGSLSRTDLEILLEIGQRIENGTLAPSKIRTELLAHGALRRAFGGWTREQLIALGGLLVATVTLVLMLMPSDGSEVNMSPEQFQQLIEQIETQPPVGGIPTGTTATSLPSTPVPSSTPSPPRGSIQQTAEASPSSSRQPPDPKHS